MHTPRLTLLRAAILSASAFGINNTWAADPAPATPNTPATADTAPALDAVIVTGTRAPERTASQSLSPIDVISGDTLRNSGSSELGTVLARLIPSINFPRPGLVDGAELARPAQLRGLSPDQVLVLVNGKRRHTGAFVNLGGATGRGSAPTDLNAIPMSSIDHIEVLRDGAAARYGSDAIAGVINIILKNSDHGGSVASEFGEYKKGDGIQRKVSGDAGTTLGKDGFFHISGEADNDDYTDRAGDDYRAASVGSTTYGEHVFRQGEPETHDGSFFFNSEYDFSDAAQFYSFGGYSKRRGETAAFYRASNASNNNPAIYPNGYLPLINGVLQDTSLVVGLRGDVLQDWHYDLSANYGKNSYGINTKTINTSLGLATPHSFDNGTLTNDQRQVTLDLSRELNVGFLPNPVSVAFGTEYLHQDYQIESGDPASYYQTGASGLGGFRDTDAGSWSRQDWAQYLDLETKFTDKWSGSVAVRHEDYSDFGNNTSGSFATRYQFTPEVAVRGSVSNGFRAPSLAQQHFTNTSSQLIGNVVQEAGTFPSDSKVAKLLGADDLKPEKSKNISVGLLLEPTSNLTFTADVYRIYIDDRITLSSNLTLNQAAINYLQANGVGDINYTTARYFTNAVNTQTDGIDLVGNYRYQFDNGVRWNSTVGYNYNHDKVTDVKANPAVLNQLGVDLQRVDRRERIGLLGDTTPEHKLTLGNDFFYGNWALHSTAVRYGEYTSYQADKVNDQTFSAAWVLDLAADYKWKNWTFTLGGDNVTDKYPEKLDPYASSGGNLAYSTFSPYGYSGAFYYGKVAYNW